MTITPPAIPPIEWFRNPNLDELTPLTVTAEGRVYGHIAGWGTPHQSFPGRNITPPRSRTDYALFHTGALQVDDGGEVRDISVGHLAIGSGHADTHLDHKATAEFYDNVASVAADVCVGEDRHGIWFSGALAPDMDELRARRFRSCALSGDWRAVNGNLELTAVLSVVTPGFPIPRARVASGAPLALVAAGALAPAAPFGRTVDPSWHADDANDDHTGGDGDDLTAEQAALLAAIDDTPALVASLLDTLDETPQQVAALLAALDDEQIPPGLGELSADDVAALGRLDRSPRKNWVEEQGGLPDYIDRIANHLHGKGMSISHAIATAVNAAKKMCSTGDLNWPGLQKVNPGSRAQACAAVAQWEAMKKAARGS